MSWRVDRRTLLRSGAAIAIGLPLLDAMEAVGQTVVEGPRRFGTYLMMASPVASKWWPTAGATESDFTLQATTASLQALKSKLLFLKGIRYASADIADVGDGHHRVSQAI